MRFDAQFIYHPRSGNRLICPATEADERLCTQRLPIVRWPSGSVHVPGERIEVDARMPGAWWRDRARDVTHVLANTLGGVAYDANGVVGVIVPPGSARFASATLLAAAPAHTFDERALATLCAMPAHTLRSWRTIAPFVRADEWVERFGTALRDNLVTPVGVPTWRYTLTIVGGNIVVDLEATTGDWARIAAPSTWGLPTVVGATQQPLDADEFVPDGFADEMATAQGASPAALMARPQEGLACASCCES